MSFADDVKRWAQRTRNQMLAVFQRATVLLAEEMAKPKPEGATPHLTGNLIRSLLAQVNGRVNVGAPDDEYAGTDVGLAVASAVLGDSITLGFQANYARRMNFGFVGQDSLGRTYNQAGNHFVERAAALWPQLVDQAAREAGR